MPAPECVAHFNKIAWFHVLHESPMEESIAENQTKEVLAAISHIRDCRACQHAFKKDLCTGFVNVFGSSGREEASLNSLYLWMHWKLHRAVRIPFENENHFPDADPVFVGNLLKRFAQAKNPQDIKPKAGKP